MKSSCRLRLSKTSQARILREEAPDVEITLMTKSSPELADGLMQGKIDVALLRREAQTAGLAFKFEYPQDRFE